MVIEELKEKLDNEFEKYYKVILVNGEWGIGKTHYLKKVLENKEHIYVSLFGIDKLDDLKQAIYYELNKLGALVNKFIKNNTNRDIGISVITLPIPNISYDIDKNIKKKLNDKNLILVIDDLERKSDNINIKELLGFIESLSEIEHIKIIVVANEKYLDKEEYKNFKEKVINKTYNITKYSEDAVNAISKQLVEVNPIEKIISNEDFNNEIKNILCNHKIKNLRTLKKAILFTKIFLETFDNKWLKQSDILEVIKICFAIVIEDCDNLYSSLEKTKSLEECILTNYLNDTFISGKYGIIRPIINIYRDDNTSINYNKALDYYIGKYSITVSEKNIFYCSEQEVEQRLAEFVNNNIKKINNQVEINVWFKELNELYPWAEKIDKSNIFKEEEIVDAIDKYVEKVVINDTLYNLIDRTIPFALSHKNMERYYGILKSKLTIHYFVKSIEIIKELLKVGEYDVKIISELLDSLGNSYLIDESTRGKLIDLIKENNFFIPDINGDISEEQWHWCHIIWGKCSIIGDKSVREKLYIITQKIIEKYTIIGKYRINSLNEQYNIKLDEDVN